MAYNPRKSKTFKQAKVDANDEHWAIKKAHSIIRRFRNFPFFILLTSICQFAVFFWYYSREQLEIDVVSKNPLTIRNYCGGCSYPDRKNPCKMIFGLDFIWELRGIDWSVWTYQFAHKGFLHLFGNAGIQCIVGVPLERQLGTALVAILYTMGVISWPLLALNPDGILHGSSNGVASLIAAYLTIGVMNIVNGKMNRQKYSRSRFFITIFTIAVFIYDCKFSVGQHVSGYITGMAFSILFADQRVETKSRDTLIKLIRVCIVVSTAAMALRTINPPLSSASSWQAFHALYKIKCGGRLNESS